LPDELPLLTAQEATDSETVNAFNQAWQYLGIAGQSLFSITATLLLAFYWTIEGSRLKQAMLFLLPVERRDAGRELVADVEAKLGQYVVGQALLMLVVGAMSFVAYLLIRLPYALVLAIIAGILEAVPLIGPGLGAIPAALVAYADEPTKVIWVLVATLVIQQIENNLLVPRIMSRTVGVNPLVTLLAFIALGSLFGIAGAIAAIPIAAVAQLLLNRFLLNPDATTEAKPGGRDRFSVLRYEAQELVRDVRKQAQTNAAGQDDEEHSLEDSLEAIATKLDELLAENGTREAER
jgi:predicted PurR-regulated permease PerM